MFKVGFGYDVHKLAKGESLILGGIEIEHTKGTVAHSDGDVLIHAIIDAMLGADAQKDIGYWFPDNNQNLKGIDSKILLKKANEILKNRGFKIGNIDSTIAAQQPKLKPYIDQMRQKLADVLELEIENISVKATTTEKLGFEGREEGISAYAVVLIHK
ncbi:MAG: 2-C-methyl-D-erythritol 2,4-cyclodiphosphate synthase [Bacteroidales bacterium]|nr:2-C-methyl-D-erythritol 2,4-cyclodiphosphate synthase [Bacteroidales bacterium]